MTSTVLLWGRRGEAPLEDVHTALIHQGTPVFLLDEARMAAASLQVPAGSVAGGLLRVDGQTLDLHQVTAVYFRPYGAGTALDRVEQARRPLVAERMDALAAALWAWTDVTPALVLNRPSLMASNGSKPLQAALLSACGFSVPETLVTMDPQDAAGFIARQGAVIFKSISGIRSIVRCVESDDLPRLSALAHCPVQFQARVTGTDVRVHVVGDAIFACELQSDADDYRYSARQGLTTTMTACTLPRAIEDRCRLAASRLGLPLCGIDLRRTPAGEWFAFEVNPSPGYTYFANGTGAPIAQAIASLLARGDRD